MERNLGTDIIVDQDGSAHISIYDNENGEWGVREIFIDKDVDCDNADDLAKEIGYTFLEWVAMTRDIMNNN